MFEGSRRLWETLTSRVKTAFSPLKLSYVLYSFRLYLSILPFPVLPFFHGSPHRRFLYALRPARPWFALVPASANRPRYFSNCVILGTLFFDTDCSGFVSFFFSLLVSFVYSFVLFFQKLNSPIPARRPLTRPGSSLFLVSPLGRSLLHATFRSRSLAY